MRSILFIAFLVISLFSRAQNIEINPSIGWNYIKSQELELTDELWYNTDFPAESGYDYIFIMNHSLDTAAAAIQVFDMQDGFITGKNNDTSVKLIDLAFDVKVSGVYRVFFRVADRKPENSSHKVQFMLIRRKKI